jgi:hypothetical protein
MSRVYQVISLEKKNVVVTYEIFEDMGNNNIRGWQIEETYRWGAGYRSVDDPISEWETNNNGIYCDFSLGSESDDLIACYYQFDEGFTDQEKADLEQKWEEGGAAWLYDGEHNWEVENANVVIYGPVKINLIDELTGDIIEEDIKPTSSKAELSWQTISDDELKVWPFPVNEISGKTDIN